LVSRSMQAPLKFRLTLRKTIKFLGYSKGCGTFSKGAIWAAYLARPVPPITGLLHKLGSMSMLIFLEQCTPIFLPHMGGSSAPRQPFSSSSSSLIATRPLSQSEDCGRNFPHIPAFTVWYILHLVMDQTSMASFQKARVLTNIVNAIIGNLSCLGYDAEKSLTLSLSIRNSNG